MNQIEHLTIPDEAFESIFREFIGNIVIIHLFYVRYKTESGDIIEWSPKNF